MFIALLLQAAAASEQPASSGADASQVTAELLNKEVARRRNFAIISHPDAGKTTLVSCCQRAIRPLPMHQVLLLHVLSPICGAL